MTMLPNKLSDLLELALSDLAKVEEDPDYVVEMGDWHWPRDDGRCSVCLAGAVLAKTVGIPKGQIYAPSSVLSDVLSPKMVALNELRQGKVCSALMESMRGSGLSLSDVQIEKARSAEMVPAAYDEDRDQFVTDMVELVRRMRREGL